MRPILLLLLAGCTTRATEGDSDSPTGGGNDADYDGVGADADCDDGNPLVGEPSTFYIDIDRDGFGNPDTTQERCVADGWVEVSGDCDDSVTAVHPGATERCDGVDEDCDGAVDDDAADAETLYVDADGDGFGSEQRETCPAEGLVDVGGDCDDADVGIQPDAEDVCGDDIDQDCTGADLGCPWVGSAVVGEGSSLATILGEDAGNWIGGHDLAYGPDLDDDGQADLIIGAPLADDDGLSEGRLYVFTSLPSGTVSAEDADIILVTDSDRSVAGWALAFGDLDGDGRTDLAMGDFQQNGGRGAVYVYTGGTLSSGGVTEMASLDWQPSGASYYGEDIEIGDGDGDGAADLLVEQFYTGPDLHYGPLAVGGSAPTADLHVEPGCDDAALVDLDGDGAAELVCGYTSAPGGHVYVVGAGLTGTVTFPGDADAAMDAEKAYDNFGVNVYGDHDLTGDGYRDLLVRAVDGDGAFGASVGTVYVISGSWTGTVSAATADAVVEGTKTGLQLFGATLSTSDDVTGDGEPDLLLTDRYYDSDTGIAWIVSGPTLAGRITTNDADVELTPDIGRNSFGSALVGTPDMNGDGYGDLAVGAYHYEGVDAYDAGAVFLIAGGPR